MEIGLDHSALSVFDDRMHAPARFIPEWCLRVYQPTAFTPTGVAVLLGERAQVLLWHSEPTDAMIMPPLGLGCSLSRFDPSHEPDHRLFVR